MQTPSIEERMEKGRNADLTEKLYRCDKCGALKLFKTNHYRTINSQCACTKRPRGFECVAIPPEDITLDYDMPVLTVIRYKCRDCDFDLESDMPYQDTLEKKCPSCGGTRWDWRGAAGREVSQPRVDSKACLSRISWKKYECTECGKREKQQTNHWGYTYGRCTCGNCEWRCLDPVPEGLGIPTPWKKVKLGDVAEIS